MQPLSQLKTIKFEIKAYFDLKEIHKLGRILESDFSILRNKGFLNNFLDSVYGRFSIDEEEYANDCFANKQKS